METITLKLTQKPTIFESQDFNEIISKQLLIKIIQKDLLKTEKDYLMVYKSLKSIKRKLKNNICPVKYTRKVPYGRVYTVKSMGYQGFNKNIRHTLAKENYVDIDMENAHPEIYYQVLKQNDIKCPNLERYVKNREKLLKRAMKDLDYTRAQAKNLFISMINLGNPINLLENTDYDYNDKKFSYINKFCKEMRKVSKLVINSNETLEKVLKKHYNKKSVKKSYTPATLIHHFLSEYENRILETVYKTLQYKKLIDSNKCSLCFDGIMILKNENINPELLITLSKRVSKKTGFNIKFVIKEMNSNILLEEDEKEEEIDEIKFEKFSRNYMNGLKTFSAKMKYWENFCAKVLIPEPCYVFHDKIDNNNIMYSPEKMKEMMKGISSEIFNEKSGDELPFYTVWSGSKNQKQYRKFDFIPFNPETPNEIPDDIYNLFNGFNPAINTEYNEDKRDDILKPYLDLLLEICGGEQKNLDFFLYFISNLVKEPNIRPPIAFILKGSQGIGKNICLNPIVNIITKKHFISSSNPKDFFGDHAEGFFQKILVNLNEAEGKDTFDFEGKMKSFITDDTLTYNPKFIRPITVQNWARTIITTNKPNPIRIDVRSGDRRYVVFKGTEKYLSKKYNTKFWTKLYKYCNQPKFISAFYDYLMEIDYSDVNWIKDRPITQDYLDMVKQFIPIEAMFLDKVVNEATHYQEMPECLFEDDDSDDEEEKEPKEIEKEKKERKQKDKAKWEIPNNLIISDKNICYKLEDGIISFVKQDLYKYFLNYTIDNNLCNTKYSAKRFYPQIKEISEKNIEESRSGKDYLSFNLSIMRKFLIRKKYSVLDEGEEEEIEEQEEEIDDDYFCSFD